MNSVKVVWRPLQLAYTAAAALGASGSVRVGRAECPRPLGRAFGMAAGVEGSAVFSDCGGFRFALGRRWGEGPRLLWLCMNPAAATDLEDDATVRRLVALSRANGAGSLVLCNVLAFRATDPAAVPDPGPAELARNLAVLGAEVGGCKAVVLAYGRLLRAGRPVAAWDRARDAAVGVLRAAGRPLLCLGRNGDGSPRHPRGVYGRLGDVRLVPFG